MDIFPPITTDMLRRRTSTGIETINPAEAKNPGQNVHHKKIYEVKGFDLKKLNNAMGSLANIEIAASHTENHPVQNTLETETFGDFGTIRHI